MSLTRSEAVKLLLGFRSKISTGDGLKYSSIWRVRKEWPALEDMGEMLTSVGRRLITEVMSLA